MIFTDGSCVENGVRAIRVPLCTCTCTIGEIVDWLITIEFIKQNSSQFLRLLNGLLIEFQFS